MGYVPKLNDYVKWKDSLGRVTEGWVYFIDSSYITIEIGVQSKDEENIKHCPIHKKTHCCVLCFPENWQELEYIKSRENDVNEYKSQRYRDADLYG